MWVASGHFGCAEANTTGLWRYHSGEGIYRNNIKMEYIWKSYRDHHPRGDSPAYIRLHSEKSQCRWYPIFTSIGNNYKHLLHIPLFLYPISRVSACLLLRRSETVSSFEFITLVEKIPTSAVRVSSMYSKKSYPVHNVVLVRGRSWTGGQERVQVKHEGQSQSICWTGWKATNRTRWWRRQTFDYRSFTLFVMKHVGVFVFFWH